MNTKNITLLLFIAMLCGLFWSRALLSLVHIAWLIFILAHYKAWKPFLTRHPLLLWSFCPVVLSVLGCWQQPLEPGSYDYLLTVSVYPIAAFAISSIREEGTKRTLLKIWGGATVIGIAYPLYWFLRNSKAAIQSYGQGSSLPTLMDNDHLRFGIFLAAGLLLLLTFPVKKTKRQYLLSGLLLCTVFFLSVRTAWLMTAMILLCFLVFPDTKDIFRRRLKIFLLLVPAIWLSYLVFPTMQKKIAYTFYDWQQYQPGKYDPRFSDGARRAVNYTAWQSVTKENGANKGWAAIPANMTVGFEKYFPGTPLNFHWPFNQYLFWWMGSGLLGMIAFTAWLLYPVVWGWKNNNKAIIAWSVAIAAACLFESNLSFQYGVWLHAWPMALLWKRKDESGLLAT